MLLNPLREKKGSINTFTKKIPTHNKGEHYYLFYFVVFFFFISLVPRHSPL